MKLFLPKYPAFLKYFYPNRISRIDRPNSIYLTFDDGPIPEVTPWVLDQLKQFKAKASFFCIGDNIAKHPDEFQKVLVEGHAVGNHTYNHLNGWKTPVNTYLENSLKAEKVLKEGSAIEKARNINSPNHELPTPTYPLFRPPFGKITNTQAKTLTKEGFRIVMWDVVSGDYDDGFSAEQCFQNVIKNAKSGSTIVLHDSQKAFPRLRIILPEILEYYSKKGFEFRTLRDVV